MTLFLPFLPFSPSSSPSSHPSLLPYFYLPPLPPLSFSLSCHAVDVWTKQTIASGTTGRGLPVNERQTGKQREQATGRQTPTTRSKHLLQKIPPEICLQQTLRSPIGFPCYYRSPVVSLLLTAVCRPVFDPHYCLPSSALSAFRVWLLPGQPTRINHHCYRYQLSACASRNRSCRKPVICALSCQPSVRVAGRI